MYVGMGGCRCVCRGVCTYVCTAMRFVVLWGIKLKLGMGVGIGSPRFESIFSKRPHQRLKVIQRSSYFKNGLWPPDLVGRTPYWSVVIGSKVKQGSAGVDQGQIAKECCMATKFGRTNPWPKCSVMMGLKIMATRFGRKNPWSKNNALLGSNVMQRSTGVNQGSNCYGIP